MAVAAAVFHREQHGHSAMQALNKAGILYSGIRREAKAEMDDMKTEPTQDAEVASVIENIETFTQCLIEKDFERWLGYWAEDGVLMPPGRANVVGRDAIGNFVRAGFGEVQSMILSNWNVDVEGDLAAAASDVTWRTKSGSVGTLKQVLVLRRAPDGRWIRRKVIYNEPGSS